MQNGVFVPVLSFGGASGASGASGGGASGASGGGPSISMGAADDNNSNNLKSASGGAFKSIQLGGTFAYWHARNNAQLEHIDALETLTESLKEENANLKKQLDTSQTKHCHAERCLKAEQAVSRELNERLESAMRVFARLPSTAYY